MSYTLAALAASEEILRTLVSPYKSAVIVPLKQSIAMVPNTAEFFLEVQEGIESGDDLPFSEFRNLSVALAQIVAKASVSAPIGYIEAEFWGGVGEQAALLWQEGKVAFGPYKVDDDTTSPLPELHDWPINTVLRLLGVQAATGKDEFDTVGLGKFRSTDDWVESVE